MAKKCIGVDVGGTTVKIGLFEITGELLKKWEVPTRTEEHGKYILNDVADSILETLKQENILLEDVEGIGIGVPGPVKKDGYVEVPKGPGLGIELNEDAIQKYRQDTI